MLGIFNCANLFTKINYQLSLSLSLSLSPPPSLPTEALLPALIQNRTRITSAHSSCVMTYLMCRIFYQKLEKVRPNEEVREKPPRE